MARFPRSEAEIVALARDVIAGLTDDPSLLEGSPVSVAEIKDTLAEYRVERNTATADAARAIISTKAKNSVVKKLAQLVKRVLRYAESEHRHDPAKLLKLGWGPPRHPVDLEQPGQPLGLRKLEEGKNTISLAWNKPPDGGKVAAYRVERKQWREDEWCVVGTAVKQRIKLKHQGEGIVWSYRVIAVNKAGEGTPSNVVKAVL